MIMATSSSAPAVTASLAGRSDPSSLLDSLDAFTSSRAAAAAALGDTAGNPGELNPVDFINRHYANEHLLISQLPSLRMAANERMDSLEDRISTALQSQSQTSESTQKHVRDAKTSILSLEKRIRLVQEKASQSERAVLEITKDMKRLDCAKRHLQRTITTLKRLHMLVHAVEQLRLACLLKPFPDYRTASQLVDATRLLLKHFDAYTHKVEQMRLLDNKVNGLQSELHNGLVQGFRIVGFGLVKAMELQDAEGSTALAPTPIMSASSGTGENGGETDELMPLMSPQVMADGTSLIDSLGADARRTFIANICKDHLNEYDTLFVPQAQKAIKQHSFKMQQKEDLEKAPYAIEQVDRRFAWYRRVLREVCDKFPDVFPIYWNFQHAMTVTFLGKTYTHLLGLLDGPTKDKDSDNATILLKALQKTILFEKEMMAWLQRDFGVVFLTGDDDTKAEPKPIVGDDGEALEFDESGRAVAAESAQGIRIKYERQKKEQMKGDKIAAAALDEGRASVEQVPVSQLIGCASSAFDNYMTPYIALEEQSMDEQLVESLSDGAVDSRGELPVFTSSTGLFVYMKGSITRCTAMTKGKAFFLLVQAFQDSLNKYAQILSSKLPNPANAAKPSSGGINISNFGKQQQQPAKKPPSSNAYIIPPGGEESICHVVSTCEYCADTVEALEDLIRDTIDEDFKEKVDMTAQQENFHDVTAKCIIVLVSGLMSRVVTAFKSMYEVNWAAFEEVGEESPYVRKIQKELEQFVATVRGLIPSSYFRNFCDKFATSFSSYYYKSLIRQKRMSELATQQLLLDVYNLKTVMLKIPVIEVAQTTPGSRKAGGATCAPAMYTKMVNKQFKRIETLLKLVGTPNTMLIDVFRVQWPGGSALDLQSVMNLKGLKRNEQAAMLEKIGLDAQTALRGATAGVTSEDIVSERMEELRQRSTHAAAKVSSDLTQMRSRVDEFRKAFR